MKLNYVYLENEIICTFIVFVDENIHNLFINFRIFMSKINKITTYISKFTHRAKFYVAIHYVYYLK